MPVTATMSNLITSGRLLMNDPASLSHPSSVSVSLDVQQELPEGPRRDGGGLTGDRGDRELSDGPGRRDATDVVGGVVGKQDLAVRPCRKTRGTARGRWDREFP